jgi:hypothetical protein
MTDPRCMEVIVEPKQVCHDRAKGFDGDKPRLALASPRRCNAAAKTVAIGSRKIASESIPQPDPWLASGSRQC